MLASASEDLVIDIADVETGQSWSMIEFVLVNILRQYDVSLCYSGPRHGRHTAILKRDRHLKDIYFK